VWSRTTSVVVRALIVGSWNCSFVHQSGISKLFSLHVLCIEKEKKREQTKRKGKRIKKRNKKEFGF